MAILPPLYRAERKLLQKLIRKTKDKHFARRFIAMLIQLCQQDFGYQRNRWSSELLAMLINAQFKLSIAGSTVRRLLLKAGIVLLRSAPILRIKDLNKDDKMSAINQALEQCCAEHPVFYEDEVDIDLNPQIGADWMPKGQQKRVVTFGKNRKYYMAGALHACSGKVVYMSCDSKTPELFITILEKLKRHYRKVKTIMLIQDNYIIHKSRKTVAFAQAEPQIQITISAGILAIERLWLALHGTVTRNHSCRNMRELLVRYGILWGPFPLFRAADMVQRKCSSIRISYLDRHLTDT